MHVQVSVRHCMCVRMRTRVYVCVRTQCKVTRVELYR